MDSLHHVPPLSPLSALKRPELEARLVKQERRLIEQEALLVEQSGAIVELKRSLAELREEIARLKGLKGRPKIKPSGMDKGTEPAKSSKDIKRPGRGKVTPRVAVENEVIRVEIPPDSIFKGHEPFLVQDLVISAVALYFGTHHLREVSLRKNRQLALKEDEKGLRSIRTLPEKNNTRHQTKTHSDRIDFHSMVSAKSSALERYGLHMGRLVGRHMAEASLIAARQEAERDAAEAKQAKRDIEIATEALKYEMAARQQTQSRLAYMDSHDALTALPNRRLFNEVLHLETQKALRRGRKLALLYIDLDHFKDVNDMVGRAVGDRLLQQFSARIASLLRAGDTLARIGGDEFALLLLDPEDVGDTGDNRLPFQINDYGPIDATLYPSPVVDPGNSNRWWRRRSRRAPLELLQDGIIAHPNAQTCQQAFCRLAACCMAQQPDKFRDAAGTPNKRERQLRQLFNKSLMGAIESLAAPPHDGNFQRH